MSNILRILYPIRNFYPSQVGGPSNSIYWLSKSLSLRKIKPIVLTTREGIESIQKVKKSREDKLLDGIYAEYNNYLILSWLSPRLFFSIISRVPRYDIVHIHSIFFIPGQFAVLIARLTGKPYLVSPRGEFQNYALGFGKLKKKIFLKLIYKNLKNATAFHATSEFEAQSIRNYFPEKKIYILPNFVSHDPLKKKPLLFSQRNELKTFLGFNSKKLILYMGRLHKIKGIENLLEAFNLSGLSSDVILLVAGQSEDGHYEPLLKKMAKDLGVDSKVHFLGQVEGDQKEKLYQCADVLVLPSYSENFGNVVIEALQYGTPVIASKGTPWSVLEEFHCGKWISNTPSEIANALDCFLCKSSDDLEMTRERAFNLYQERFKPEAIVSAYELMYREVKK